MDNLTLQKLVEQISSEYFKKPFRHKASFNNRLRTTGGRYLTKSHNLEFNYKSYEKHGIEELIAIIKHELCHYHLHLSNKGFHHRDNDFKECLNQVKGNRYSKPVMNRKGREYKYVITCLDCHQKYSRIRKMEVRKYRCGTCGGKLEINSIGEGG